MNKDLFMPGTNGSDNSSDSDNSDDEDRQEQELATKAKQLENDISDNKYLYDTHIELIGIYKQLGDLKSVREAFQRFHEYFPLTPALWMDWINLEKNLATTDTQKEYILGLFDKAVEDYLSVELWSEYAQYAIGATDLEKTRIILERGVNAAGLVCNGASLLWATYREIENLHISLYEEGSEAWEKQVLKLADVFKRELSIPLLEMENTYEEWKTWCNTLPKDLIDVKPVEYGFNKAKKTLEIYKPFEEQLLTAKSNEELLLIYRNYIKIIKDPSTVICVYERAGLQLCLIPEFWCDYCLNIFKLGDQALSVCIKALRNCPWSEELWILKIRVLEHLEKKENTVMECFEEGLASIAPNPGLEMWLAYLEYTHRCVGSPEKLDKLFKQAIEQLGHENDPECKVSRLFSRILAHRGSMKEARKLWGQIMFKPENKGSVILWLEYTNLEKQYGESQMLRNLYQRALNSVKDFPGYIVNEWVLFERHTGTLDDVMKCLKVCKEANISWGEHTVNSIAKPIEERGKKRKLQTNPPETIEVKRSRYENIEDTPKFKPMIDKNPDTTVFVSNLLPGVTEKQLKIMFPNALNLEIAKDRKEKSRCFGYVQFKTKEEVMVALARDREPLKDRPVFISEIKTDRTEKKPSFKYATNEEKNKLFIKGLPVKKTREEIEAMFKKYGAKEVRLVLHKSGQPKGLAYVEFETENQARQALNETDQMDIDGHTISVAVSAPPPKKDKFHKHEEEPISHPRSRLQTSLLPRSLQVKAAGTSKGEEVNGSGQKMKSNSDFRALLLKK